MKKPPNPIRSIGEPQLNEQQALISPERLSFTIAEAARLTSLGRTSLYALIGAGKLRKVKIGKRTVIRRDDLEALLQGGATLGPVG